MKTTIEACVRLRCANRTYASYDYKVKGDTGKPVVTISKIVPGNPKNMKP